MRVSLCSTPSPWKTSATWTSRTSRWSKVSLAVRASPPSWNGSQIRCCRPREPCKQGRRSVKLQSTLRSTQLWLTIWTRQSRTRQPHRAQRPAARLSRMTRIPKTRRMVTASPAMVPRRAAMTRQRSICHPVPTGVMRRPHMVIRNTPAHQITGLVI